MKRITIKNLLRVAGLAALFLMVSATTSVYRPPFGEWRRLHNGEPTLVPQGNGWEAGGVFNPAAVRHEGKIVLTYRAQDKKGLVRDGQRWLFYYNGGDKHIGVAEALSR